MPAADFIRVAETGIPFIIDEAYIEYAGLGMSQVGLTKKYKNVMITRTFSKAYGLAGLRFGYILADREVAMKIAATLLPWNVGTIVMWAALAGLEDQEALAQRVKFNNDQVAYIEEMMGKIPGMVVFPSKANYILFDAGATGKKSADILAYAQTKGLILRGESAKYGSDGWFRVTIGSKEENEMFIKTMHEYFTK
jgi:histidinol-phosphate aminotransferase